MKNNNIPPLPYIGELLEFVIRAFSHVEDQNEPALKKELQRLKSGTIILPEDVKQHLHKHLAPLPDDSEFGLEFIEALSELFKYYADVVMWIDCRSLHASEVRDLLIREVVPNLCISFAVKTLPKLRVDPHDWLKAPETAVSDVWNGYLETHNIAIPRLAKEIGPKLASKKLETAEKTIEDNLYRWQKGGRMNVRSILQLLEIGYETLALALLFANAFQRFWASQSKETRLAVLPNWNLAYSDGPRIHKASEIQSLLSTIATEKYPELHAVNENSDKKLCLLRDLTNPQQPKMQGDADRAEVALLGVEKTFGDLNGIDGLLIYRGRFHILKGEPKLALEALDRACKWQAYRNGPAMLETLKPLLVTSAFIDDKRMLKKWSGWAEAMGLELDLRRPDALFYRMFPPENYYKETDTTKYETAKAASISANLILESDWEKRPPDLRNPNRKIKGYCSVPNPQLSVFAHSKQPEKVKLLLDAGADPNALCANNGSALLNAIQTGCNESFAILLPVTNLKIINQRTKQTGRTCLGEAVSLNNLNMVRALLGYRANPDMLGELDTTPLYQAVSSIMENAPAGLFEQAGINPAALNVMPPSLETSASPFMNERLAAMERQHQKTISKHPDLHKELKDFFINGCGTSLEDRLKIISELLAAGANPNAKAKGGFTPFLLACVFGNNDVIETLLKHGANPRDKDDSGQTPLFLMTSGGHKKLAQWFLSMLPPKDAKYLQMQPNPKFQRRG